MAIAEQLLRGELLLEHAHDFQHLGVKDRKVARNVLRFKKENDRNIRSDDRIKTSVPDFSVAIEGKPDDLVITLLQGNTHYILNQQLPSGCRFQENKRGGLFESGFSFQSQENAVNVVTRLSKSAIFTPVLLHEIDHASLPMPLHKKEIYQLCMDWKAALSNTKNESHRVFHHLAQALDEYQPLEPIANYQLNLVKKFIRKEITVEKYQEGQVEVGGQMERRAWDRASAMMEELQRQGIDLRSDAEIIKIHRLHCLSSYAIASILATLRNEGSLGLARYTSPFLESGEMQSELLKILTEARESFEKFCHQ